MKCLKTKSQANCRVFEQKNLITKIPIGLDCLNGMDGIGFGFFKMYVVTS